VNGTVKTSAAAHTGDDDRPACDALSDAEMEELAGVLAEAAYPGGIEAFAEEARQAIASCCGAAVWKDLELDEALALTDAEALAGMDRHFGEYGGGLDGFIEAIWARPARRFRP